MVGERIKLKRQANKMSLSELAEHMAESGVSISKGALSNYETGKSEPNEKMLRVLARELGTTVGFLRNDSPVHVDVRLSRDVEMVNSDRTELYAYIQIQLEKRIEIDRVLGHETNWRREEPVFIEEYDAQRIEEETERIRSLWGLCDMPISSVCGLIENMGWDVFDLPGAFGLNSISGYEENTQTPFLYYSVPSGVVNLRMRLLEEVANMYFTFSSERVAQKVRRHFAGAILFTKEQALREFGCHRTRIMPDELTIAKQRYGLPKYEVMHRLWQLGVISVDMYMTYRNIIRQRGYPSGRDSMKEPLFFYEIPNGYKMKVLNALAEGLISEKDMAAIEFQSGGYA